MATDDSTSKGKPATPSLLAGRTSVDERDSKSSRILANLEGREAEPERQHLPVKEKRSRRSALLLLLLLLVGVGAGLGYWRTAQRGSVMAVAQGNAAPGQAPSAGAAGARTPAAVATAAGPATAAADTPAPGQGLTGPAAAAPSSAASITDAPHTADSRANDAPPATNPLSALASAPPALPASPYAKTAMSSEPPAAAKGKAPTKNTHASSKTKKKPDGDAALLSALIAYGLPVPSKGDTSAVLPGTPLSERLQLCRRKPFLESEQCRLQACAGQWGIAPECPNPQAQTRN